MRVSTIAALLTISAASASAKDDTLTDEDRADVAWFEGLGYPKVDPAKFVRVSTGGAGSSTRQEWRGFVLSDDGARTRLLTLGLDDWTIERDPPGTPDGRRRVIEPLRLSDACEEWLAGGPSPCGPDTNAPWSLEPPVATQMLVLASALAPKEETLAHDLLAHARTLRQEGWRRDREDVTRPLRERAAESLAEVELVRAKSALVGMSPVGHSIPRTRAEQRDAFRRILARFPGVKAEAEVREFADVLDRMVREEAEHAKSAKALEELAGDARIDELIFRLREETPTDGFGPMGDLGTIKAGPYVELVRLGAVAVPRLVEALSDDSLTRLGGEGRGGMDPYVEDVGDVALMAIEEIAGHGFQPSESAKLPAGDRRAYRVAFRDGCRAPIEAWFAEVKAGRELDDLARRVDDGDWQAAQTLLARDPERGSAALVHALASTKELYLRDQYLEFLAKRPGDTGLELLRHEAISGDPWTRFTAANLLAGLHDAAAPDALLALWRERRDGAGPPTSVANRMRMRDDELRTIATELLAMKRADLVTALADDLPRRGSAVRRVLVEELAKARDGAAGDWAIAIEDALAQALDDFTERTSLGWRARDDAGAALAKARGLTAPSSTVSPAIRDATVDDIADAWAREHSLPPRERTALAPLPSVDAARIAQLLDAFAKAPFPSETRAAALRDIESLGVGAVPALRQAMTDGKLGYAGDLATLVAKMTFIVREIRVVPAGASVPSGVRAKLDALAGKPLSGSAFAAAVRSVVEGAPRGASLDAWRGADEPGVVVTLTMQDGPGGGWSISGGALRGERVAEDGPRGGEWSLDQPADDGSIARMTEEALAAAPSERAWVHVLVVRRPAD